MRGRPPKPSAIRVAEGHRGHRPIPGDAGLPAELPRCPAWLSKTGKKVWREISVELHRLGVLRNSDQGVLANLCDAYAIMLKARASLDRLPEDAQLMVKTSNGAVQVNPLIGIINRQRGIIQRLSAEFGLTPVARARLMAGDGAGDRAASDLEALIAADPNDPRFAEPTIQ